MMTQVTSGPQRGVSVESQIAAAGSAAKDEAPAQDFAAILQHATEATPSRDSVTQKSTQGTEKPSSLINREENGAVSAVKDGAQATRQTVRASTLKNGVSTKQNSTTGGSVDDALAPTVSNAAPVLKPGSLSVEGSPKDASKSDDLSEESLGTKASIQAPALAKPLGTAVNPLQGQKVGVPTTAGDPAVKVPAKDSKILAKQTSPIVSVPVAGAILDGKASQATQAGLIVPLVPTGQQGATEDLDEKSSSKAMNSPHVGATSRLNPIDQHGAVVQKSEIASSDTVSSKSVVSASASSTTGNEQVDPGASAVASTVAVDAGTMLSHTNASPSSLHAETRAAQAVEIPGYVRLIQQTEIGLNGTTGDHAQDASLQHTVITTTPTSLEVGVYGGTHGWLKIRAELTGTGQVNASLSGASPATASVLPALNSYLQSEQIQVGALSVHTVPPEGSHSAERSTDGVLSDLSGGAQGHAADGGAQQGEGQRTDFATQGGEEATEDRLDARTSTGAYGFGIESGGGSILSPVEYGADGSWLNVRA